MDFINKIEAKCKFNFGATVDVLSNHSEFFLVEFYENLGTGDWSLVHSWHQLQPFHFYKYNRYFRTKWKIRVWGWEEDKPVLVYEHLYCEEGKKVAFLFNHFSFKVQREWARKAIAFKNKNRCDLVIESNFSERLSHEFAQSGVFFTEKLELDDDIYASYLIKKQDIQTTTESWWESDLIFENHSRAYKSWYMPIDWVQISNEEIFDVIIGNE